MAPELDAGADGADITGAAAGGRIWPTGAPLSAAVGVGDGEAEAERGRLVTAERIALRLEPRFGCNGSAGVRLPGAEAVDAKDRVDVVEAEAEAGIEALAEGACSVVAAASSR